MKFNGKYAPVKILQGKGASGTLFLVKEISNKNNKYALKLIPNELSSFYYKEIEVLKNKRIKSKYIIELKDSFYDKKNEGFCIVMELCDGDLKQILNEYKLKRKGLPLNIINKIFIQLNEALKVMINNKYTHRDLKPGNILIKYTDEKKIDFDIKLTDFGLSTDEVNSTIKTHAGTPNYMAPEIEKIVSDEKCKYNNKCDLWSLGVILYELYTNEYIFSSTDPIKREINRNKGIIKNETDNEMINKLIKKLIQIDIDKRINWEEYFKDDFFNENLQIIKIKIKVDENKEIPLKKLLII